MDEFQELLNLFGEFKTTTGELLALIQQPYIKSYYGYNFYCAQAIDKFENNYEICWQVINSNCEDESDACNWESYIVRKLGSL